eukprot:8550626-Pyramimonas_sp.AAC.1
MKDQYHRESEESELSAVPAWQREPEWRKESQTTISHELSDFTNPLELRTEELLSGTYADDRRAIIEFHELHSAKKAPPQGRSGQGTPQGTPQGDRILRSPPVSTNKATHVLNPLHVQSTPVRSDELEEINSGHATVVLNPLTSPPAAAGGGDSILPNDVEQIV